MEGGGEEIQKRRDNIHKDFLEKARFPTRCVDFEVNGADFSVEEERLSDVMRRLQEETSSDFCPLHAINRKMEKNHEGNSSGLCSLMVDVDIGAIDLSNMIMPGDGSSGRPKCESMTTTTMTMSINKNNTKVKRKKPMFVIDVEEFRLDVEGEPGESLIDDKDDQEWISQLLSGSPSGFEGH